MKKLSLVTALVISLAAAAQTAQKPRWVAYKSVALSIEVTVPADWAPSKIPKALAFHYDDQAGGTAAIGILKSDKISNIEEAADKEYQPETRPPDWVRTAATIAGNRAIKIVGSDKDDSAKRIVHYFVDTPNGVYIIQCIGTADRWSTFGSIFGTILTKLKFL